MANPNTTTRKARSYSSADIVARETRRRQLAEDTHIPMLNFRWYVDYAGDRTLQQRCTTPGGTPFWKDVAEFTSDEGERGDE